MAYGKKSKTVSRLAAVNRIVQAKDNVAFKKKINDDTVLKKLNQDMVTYIGQAKAKLLGPGTNVSNIKSPPPVPVPKARWFGEFEIDATSPTTTASGKPAIMYDHQKAMRLNAKLFRDRFTKLLRLISMENDLTQSFEKPNKGGQAGTHSKTGTNDPT